MIYYAARNKSTGVLLSASFTTHSPEKAWEAAEYHYARYKSAFVASNWEIVKVKIEVLETVEVSDE